MNQDAHGSTNDLRGRYLPQSSLGQAVDYALGQWPALAVDLQDGRVEIDNYLVENAIRPTAIGKMNWLCIGAPPAQAPQRQPGGPDHF